MGGAIAEAAARRGAQIAITFNRSRENAEAIVGRLGAAGTAAAAFAVDVADADAITRLVADVRDRLGRIDVLVNMASLYERTPLATVDPSVWKRNLDIELRAAFLLALQAAPELRRHGSGRIVNFADWLAASGRPRYSGYLPYYVAKSGIIGLTQGLALELAPEILVNAIAPGPILKPADLPAAEDEQVLRETPLRRWGGVREVVKTVLFLIETDFITGECIRVDGGRHLY